MDDVESRWKDSIRDSVREIDHLENTLERLRNQLTSVKQDIEALSGRYWDTGDPSYISTIESASHELWSVVGDLVPRVDGKIVDAISEATYLQNTISLFYYRH